MDEHLSPLFICYEKHCYKHLYTTSMNFQIYQILCLKCAIDCMSIISQYVSKLIYMISITHYLWNSLNHSLNSNITYKQYSLSEVVLLSNIGNTRIKQVNRSYWKFRLCRELTQIRSVCWRQQPSCSNWPSILAGIIVSIEKREANTLVPWHKNLNLIWNTCVPHHSRRGRETKKWIQWQSQPTLFRF